MTLVDFKRFAACDHHLSEELRKVSTKNTSVLMRVTEIWTADAQYRCGCGVPAHWYVSQHMPVEVVS